ncbi:hypothetical protein SEA_MAGRITTE_201 [Microbacterium phage Magritte]|nr:hypothetical protein SEA_MAGRITTE_201 [Microbacterium phage Magritte]
MSRKNEFEDRLKATQLVISQEMERQGIQSYRRSLVGTMSYMTSGGLIAAIAVLFSLPWIFYVFAAVLLVAAIRSWLNVRDMERFIEAVRKDMLEIQK